VLLQERKKKGSMRLAGRREIFQVWSAERGDRDEGTLAKKRVNCCYRRKLWTRGPLSFVPTDRGNWPGRGKERRQDHAKKPRQAVENILNPEKKELPLIERGPNFTEYPERLRGERRPSGLKQEVLRKEPTV